MLVKRNNRRRKAGLEPDAAELNGSRSDDHAGPPILLLRCGGPMPSTRTKVARPMRLPCAGDAARRLRHTPHRHSEAGRDAGIHELGETVIEVCPGKSGPPGLQQSANSVKAWYSRHAAVGLVVVVGHNHLGIYEYLLDEIVQVRPDRPWFRLAEHGAFDYAGRCRSAPRGRVRLLIPTQDVIHAAVAGRSWFRGHPGYSRDLLLFEKRLLQRLRPVGERGQDADSGAGSAVVGTSGRSLPAGTERLQEELAPDPLEVGSV